MLNQKGFTPIFIIIGIVAILTLSGGVYLYTNNQKSPNPSPSLPPSASVMPSEQPTPSPSMNASVKPKASVSPKATPAASVTASSTPASSATNNSSNNSNINPTSTPYPTPSMSPVVKCNVIFNPTSGTAPANIQLIYGASMSGGSNRYVTNVQWDWNGDGTWDTDFSPNNQHLSHTYTQAGTYNARLRVQIASGEISDVCTGSITIQ